MHNRFRTIGLVTGRPGQVWQCSSGSCSPAVTTSGGRSPGALRSPRHDSADQRDTPESADPRLPSDPTDSAEHTDPADPTERIDPTLPIDRIESADAIDRIERSDAIDRIDRCDRGERGSRRAREGRRGGGQERRRKEAMIRSTTGRRTKTGKHRNKRRPPGRIPAVFACGVRVLGQGTETRPRVGRKLHERGSAPSS